MNPYSFFNKDGYPLNLSLVERRDGYERQIEFLANTIKRLHLKLLDAGCGIGRLTGPLKKQGFQVVGIDIVEFGLQTAKKRYKNIPFVCADLARLPFSDAIFDCAISMYSSIGYTPGSLQPELKELRRVCKNDGLLVLDLINGTQRKIRTGIEKIPNGIGLWIKLCKKDQIKQYNFALSTKKIGIFKLAYPCLMKNEAIEVSSLSGWAIREIYGDYDCSRFTSSSPRLILVCVAS